MEFRTKLIHAGISQDQETGAVQCTYLSNVYLQASSCGTAKTI